MHWNIVESGAKHHKPTIYYAVYSSAIEKTLILFFYIDFLVIEHYSCLCIYVISSFVTWLESPGKYIYRLMHGHFHIGLVIIPRPPYWTSTPSRANMGREMITRPIWKCPCIKLFITYFPTSRKETPILAWDDMIL
jgi:hypothetical protein